MNNPRPGFERTFGSAFATPTPPRSTVATPAPSTPSYGVPPARSGSVVLTPSRGPVIQPTRPAASPYTPTPASSYTPPPRSTPTSAPASSSPSRAPAPAEREPARNLNSHSPAAISTNRIIVGINDLGVGKANLVTFGLGSCIGVCMFDPGVGVGALCHYMLPDSSIDRVKARTDPRMFGDLLIEEMLATFQKAGGRPQRSKTYIAGGSAMTIGTNLFDIGPRNATVARDLLARMGITIANAEVGGRLSRTLTLEVMSGTVTVTTPGLAPRRLS